MGFEFHDIVGTVGVILIAGSFLLLQLQRVDSNSAVYSIFNALGALAILFSLANDFNLAAFILEAFWLLTSIVGLIRRLVLGRRARQGAS